MLVQRQLGAEPHRKLQVNCSVRESAPSDLTLIGEAMTRSNGPLVSPGLMAMSAPLGSRISAPHNTCSRPVVRRT
jgi:hypothetical protein